MTPPFRSSRRLALFAVPATIAALGAGASTASAATSPLAASYNSTQAVAVQRSPAFPACSGSGASATFSPITMSGAQSLDPYSDSKPGPVDLDTVVSGGAYLKLFPSGNAAQPWGIRMFPNSAPGGAASDELRWDGSSWISSSAAGWAAAAPFTAAGQAYGLYPGGFLHNSSPQGYGTFMLIDQAWPGAGTLTYTPVAASNTCVNGEAIANAAAMEGPPTLYVVPNQLSYGAGTTPGTPTWTYRTTLADASSAVADPAAGNTGWAAPTCAVASTFTASTAAGTYSGGVTCSGGTGGTNYTLDTTATAAVVVTPAPAPTPATAALSKGTPTATRNAIIVSVATPRAGTVTVIGASRARGRWVARCVGRKTVPGATLSTTVACRLTPAAKVLLCRGPLRMRLITRLANPGMPVESSSRTVRVRGRACAPVPVAG